MPKTKKFLLENKRENQVRQGWLRYDTKRVIHTRKSLVSLSLSDFKTAALQKALLRE